MSSAKTYYEVLHVAPDASHHAIKKSWRILSQKHHPDRNPDNLKWATEQMQMINAAWTELSDPARRSRYDARLKYEREERARKAREKAEREAAAREQAERARAAENEPPPAQEPQPEKPRPQPDTSARRAPPPPPPPPPRTWGPRFLHVVAVCAGIAWLYAACMADALMSRDSSGLLFVMRLLNGALVDLAGTPFVLGLFFACVGWIVGKVLPMTRKKPSWVALASVLAFFFLLWKTLPPDAMQTARHERPAATSATPHRHAPKKKSSAQGAHASSKERKAPQAAAAMPPAQRQVYDDTVDELERIYPEINPRAPGYQPRLARKIFERKTELVDKGMAPEIAVRAATSEILDAARHRDNTPEGQ